MIKCPKQRYDQIRDSAFLNTQAKVPFNTFLNKSCHLLKHLIWLHSTFQVAKSVCYVVSNCENGSPLVGYIKLTIIHLAS